MINLSSSLKSKLTAIERIESPSGWRAFGNKRIPYKKKINGKLSRNKKFD